MPDIYEHDDEICAEAARAIGEEADDLSLDEEYPE